MPTALSMLVVLVAAQAPAAQTPAAPAPSPRFVPACHVGGTVVDERTRAGVSRAVVVLRAFSPERLQDAASPPSCRGGCQTVADGDGRFAFADLLPGDYALTASIEGFAESAPLEVRLDGQPCAVTADIPFRFQMLAEARAGLPRALGATPIPAAIAPVLTGAAIAETPGALEDLSRAFQSLPGVAGSQDNRNDLLVRGGGALENQMRIDGFDLPNVNHFGAQGGSGGALSILPPWLIERGSLEVGGFSVAFGDRMSSVADVSIRPGRRDRVHAAVGAGIGGLTAIGEGALGARGSWLVSARRSLLDAVFSKLTDEIVPAYADVLVKAEHRAGEKHRLTVLGLGSRDEASGHDEKAGDDELSGSETTALAGVRFDSSWSARAFSSVVASLSSIDVDARAVDGAVVDAIDAGKETEVRIRADVRRKRTFVGDILVGGAVKTYRYDYELFVNDLWTPYNALNRDLSSRQRRSFTDLAAYAEAERAIAGRGRLLAGVRIDRWGAASLTAGSPRVKAEIVAGRSVRLVGHWGIYRQGVPYIWMASAPDNIGLAPMASRQFGGGLDFEPRPWLRLAVEAFGKRYRNYPVDPAVPSRVLVSSAADFEPPYVGPLVGAGRVRASGIDSLAQLSPLPGLEVATNYSYWKVSQSGLDRAWRPAEHELRHQARLEVRYRPDGPWSAGFRLRHASGRPYTPFSVPLSVKRGRAAYDLTQINALNYPYYRRLDVRVDRSVRTRFASAAAYLEVDNLLNRRNVLTYRWNRALKGPKPVHQWGRTLVAGVRIEF
ncbi:MAG TPA: TonB-dependent receptor [Vicinamibacterales bacterium]|nr:TonB-dependent receptor [Vicinamibacterales bacterium]HOQ58988.1 TonB-dependent receptor [Vicinamibacterales bacterium]HPK70432.1 TonB-dependent receptor [Vicinamibacterales bacterium]